MSWWISLCEPDPSDPEGAGAYVEVTPHAEGGTYAVGGTSEATVNVTYNYGTFFPFRDLGGKTAAETTDRLRAAVAELGTRRDPDYWARTPGNAGAACALLLAWAEQHPDAVWVVH